MTTQTDKIVKLMIANMINAELNSGSDFASEYAAAKTSGDAARVAKLQREFVAHARRQFGI